jgi:hypothetical protein
VHQRARVFLVIAGQHRGQGGLVAVERDVGNKAQPPLVDAHQRRAVAGQPPPHAEHGAVAAHHQTQIALATNAVDVQRGVAGQPHLVGRLVFQRQLAALLCNEARDVFERLAQRVESGAGGRLLVFANERDVAEKGFVHRAITPSKR